MLSTGFWTPTLKPQVWQFDHHHLVFLEPDVIRSGNIFDESFGKELPRVQLRHLMHHHGSNLYIALLPIFVCCGTIIKTESHAVLKKT